MDETWLLHYTPESNRQSEWTERDEPNPKRGKTHEKTAPFEEEKVLFHQDNAPCHK
jgi:hypothetical protein